MLLLWKYGLGLFLIINLLPSVFCIKCFSCRSDNDPKCADPFDNSTVPITDCDKEKGMQSVPGVTATMCLKTRQKVNGEWLYTRGCALSNMYLIDEERPCSTNNTSIETCLCNTKDGCNSSSRLTPMIPVIFSLFVSVPYIMFKGLS